MEKTDVTQYKVVVLAGGWSDEREISMDSGRACAKALGEAGFEGVELLDVADDDFISRLTSGGYDVAFVAMHGRYGEDGCVQGVCEELGLRYTGSGVLASALAMDKSKAKVFYRAFGVPTPAARIVSAGEKVSYDEVAAELGSKVVVKPANEGSAFGVSIVSDAIVFDQALRNAQAMDTSVVIEQFIAGTEVTVAVMGNDEPRALPVIEIVPHNDFYDFEAKYAQGGSDHICPARISDELTRICQEESIAAHKALGCRGVSRSDIIIDEVTGTAYVLETNTIPGMTSTSLIPDAARVEGTEFPELCRQIVELALED